eukprot:TRINITY_DN41147_c0_g1_i1.p1 TRINITY_DN41147_c0_g1~~TRINITY_DN41147_c0_g1_i1.p1  ORF type:complete len:589 (-),score=68.69 TRINITY_DN41147_c0_g1_i1:20-1786(-)
MQIHCSHPSACAHRMRRHSDVQCGRMRPASSPLTPSRSIRGSSPSSNSGVCSARGASPQTTPGMPRRVPSVSKLRPPSGGNPASDRYNGAGSSVLYALPASPRIQACPPSFAPLLPRGTDEHGAEPSVSSQCRAAGNRRIAGHIGPSGAESGDRVDGVSAQSKGRAMAQVAPTLPLRSKLQHDNGGESRRKNSHNAISVFEQLLAALKPPSVPTQTRRCGDGVNRIDSATLLGSGLLDSSGPSSSASATLLNTALREIAEDRTLGRLDEDQQATLLCTTLRELSGDGRTLIADEDPNATLFLCEYSERAPPTRHAAFEATLIPRTACEDVEEGDEEERDDDQADFSATRITDTVLANALSPSSTAMGGAPVPSVNSSTATGTRVGIAATQSRSIAEEHGSDTPTLLNTNATEARLIGTASLDTNSAPSSERANEMDHADAAPGTETLPWSVRVANLLNDDDTLVPTGGLDGGLLDVLRRLSVDNGVENASLTAGFQRLRQLSAVIAGERLADRDIESLPKVRFEQAEMKSCAICLEDYQQGVLLTRLPCGHFFHVDCLAGWMQNATRCPLCRGRCMRRSRPAADDTEY